jgi:HAD superfamily hydrolase (TIGR01509 family)
MSFPQPVRAVIFDMDGLLVDTEVVYRDAMIAQAEAQGLELPPSVFKRMIGLPSHASDAVAQAHFGPDFDLAGYNEGVMTRVTAMIAAGVELKAGVVELLDFLDFLRLPRAIATSSSHRAVESHIGASGIIPRFDAIIAKGDYVNGKPSPDPYLRAAEAIGTPPLYCLALEDSHNGVRAAHAAGMMTVMVPDLLDPTEEMQTLCLHISESLHHVREMLEAATR